ncbi:ATP-dependent bile acid permease [Sphaceloma murrayae]|uniref:ATP-dependent bile acid permease n=1 Tax=Sphaceloma murrayae TaxID=2082308 RepID=A0A2K1QMS0_9PEZI|nr:ATP-dependent bile acid permease [Sphaceloma murrayae]
MREAIEIYKFTSFVANMPLLLSPVITFAIYLALPASKMDPANVTKVFTSLSLMVLLSEPLFNILASIIDVMSAKGCLDRIQTFLHKLERLEKRQNTAGDVLSETKVVALTDRDIVTMDHVCLAWSDATQPVVRDASIHVPASRVSMITGPVGSGKSTILRAMIGEVPCTHGDITMSTCSVAWCEQTPWLMNQTIRENIIVYGVYDSHYYAAVVHACDLVTDFSLLPSGDQTVVGSKGFTLSGGQKQRIALARAVYARKELTLLDDVFSQLDMTTRAAVFNRLLGDNGLLRQGQQTVVLATHATSFLPQADHVIEFKGDGTIAQRDNELIILNDDHDASRGDNNAVEGSGTDSKQQHGPDEGQAITLPPPDGKSETTDMSRLNGDSAIYGYYLSKLSWKVGLVFLVLQIAYAFFSTFPYVWLKWWTDASRGSSSSSNGYYIGIYAVLQSLGIVFSGTLTWWSFNVMAVSTGTSLHSTLVTTVMSASFPYISRVDSGKILTKFSQDIQLIDISLPLALQVVVGNLLICLGQMGLIASASAWIAISYPPLFVVFYFVQKYYLKTSRQMRLLDLEEKAPIYTQFMETLDGLATIRAFGWRQASVEKNFELVDKSQKPFYLMYAIQRWLALVLDLIIAALAILVVGIAVALRGVVSAGFTGVSLTQIILFTSALKLLIMFWTQLETSFGAETFEPPPDWPLTGTLQIHNLAAQYKEGSEDWASRDINVTIPAGEKVAFCGRTGSGKSTMTLTWFRLLDHAKGSIRIDGIDLAIIRRDILRERLTFVAEEPFLLPGNVRQNVDLSGNHSDNDIFNALRKTMLLDVITVAGGLDAPMTTVTLSQGQKQLFNFARALLKTDRKILILDEATSSIDQEADQVIQDLIRKDFKDHTVVAIVHRLDTILDFDNVGVMDQGRLVEYGKPSDLLAKPSRFRDLHQSGAGSA